MKELETKYRPVPDCRWYHVTRDGELVSTKSGKTVRINMQKHGKKRYFRLITTDGRKTNRTRDRLIRDSWGGEMDHDIDEKDVEAIVRRVIDRMFDGLQS